MQFTVNATQTPSVYVYPTVKYISSFPTSISIRARGLQPSHLVHLGLVLGGITQNTGELGIPLSPAYTVNSSPSSSNTVILQDQGVIDIMVGPGGNAFDADTELVNVTVDPGFLTVMGSGDMSYQSISTLVVWIYDCVIRDSLGNDA